MNQRYQIEFLIKKYQEDMYETTMFCELFVDLLYHQKDGTITEKEFSLLDKYGEIFSRFSPSGDGVKAGFMFDEKRIRYEFQKLLNEWEF